MNRISTLLIAVALPVAFAAPAIAQEGKTLGTVVNGNTTTTFKAADTRDIDTQKLKTWNAFAVGHPKVASELAHNPALINDDSFANKHPQLSAFFAAHPDVRAAMAANPGNYVAIPPRPGE
jgi:parvulin-like peptidyl-prolyl isomerase